jgi:Tfp pilus assembly protein PilF
MTKGRGILYAGTMSGQEFSFKALFIPFTTGKSVTFLILLGFLIFSPGLMNGFVGDDSGYINHPYIQQNSVWKLLSSSSTDLGGTSPVTSQFYRPLMLLVFAQIHMIFKDAAFFYHFFQIGIHIANAVLLYFLFKKFLYKPLAFGLSVVFLIHPINVEVASYVANLQDVLFMLFGLIALHVYGKEGTFTLRRQLILGGLCFLILLSKETGALFLLLLCIYHLLFRSVKTLIHILYPITLAGIVYMIFRVGIAGVSIGKSPASPMSELSLPERLLHIPHIFSYYIQTFLFPRTLSIAQTWIMRDLTSNSFYFPLLLMLSTVLLVIGGGVWMYKKHVKYIRWYSFFSLWFFLGMLPHLQLIPLEMTVATRWFYFPIIGLIGCIGIIINTFWMRDSVRKALIVVFIVLIPLLGFQTMTRLADFRDAMTLYTADSKQTKSFLLEHSLGYEYLQRGELDKAKLHFAKSLRLYETPINTTSMGVYFYRVGNIPEAQKWFYRSNALGDYYLAYQNQARLLVAHDSPRSARDYVSKAVKKFPQSDVLWFLLAIAEYKNENHTAALAAAQKAYGLNPNEQNGYVLNQLQNNLPIIIND